YSCHHSFFFYCSLHHRNLHSFPTRRSSDLQMVKNKQRKGKKVISKIITIACLAVFIYASHGLISVYIDYKQNRSMLSDVQDTYYNVASAETVETDDRTEAKGVRTGFGALLEQNENVVGWITIDGTHIDYPILQSDNNIDYLTENYNGQYSIAGSIFMDYRNDFEDNDLYSFFL